MARKTFTDFRKFSGQRFQLRSQHDYKREAQSEAERLRKRGQMVRVIPASMIGGRRVYLLYTRYK